MTTDPRDVAVRTFDAMRSGDLAAFEAICHPEFLNHEQVAEPPAARGRGPEPAYAVALWLRSAYADLRWELHEVVAEGDLAVVHCTMHGRHVGSFVAYDEDAQVKAVFPPTGKTFAAAQTHWIRMLDGLAIEHWATRDDLGQAEQLGWVPPTPGFLLRAALAKRRARREHARAA